MISRGGAAALRRIVKNIKPNDPKIRSADPVAENLERLKERFPEVIHA